MKVFYAIQFCFFLLPYLVIGQTPISGTINDYAKVTAITGNVLTVTTTTGFSVGDEILIYQVQDATIQSNPTLTGFGLVTLINSAGLFEIDTIASLTVELLLR